MATIISASSLRTTNEGASVVYGGRCEKHFECMETHFCDDKKRICNCQSAENTLTMIFNEESRKCESIVGSVCTIESGPGGLNWTCVKDAQCKWSTDLPDTLGICTCVRGRFEKNGFCVNDDDDKVRQNDDNDAKVNRNDENDDKLIDSNDIYQAVRARQSLKGARAPWNWSSAKIVTSDFIIIMANLLVLACSYLACN